MTTPTPELRKEKTFYIQDKGYSVTLAYYIHAPTVTAQFTVMGYPRSRSDTIFMPTDLGYHSDNPQYEGQKAMECDIRPGGKCYCDGTSLGASDLWREFLESSCNEDLIWKRLEEIVENHK